MPNVALISVFLFAIIRASSISSGCAITAP